MREMNGRLGCFSKICDVDSSGDSSGLIRSWSLFPVIKNHPTSMLVGGTGEFVLCLP